MKSVLISIQPYWVYLIIARKIGFDISQEKTIDVRKSRPKDNAWNKATHIYCSKNRESFNRIPKQHQPFMEKLLGKVVGEFVCDSTNFVINYGDCVDYYDCYASCLSAKEIIEYAKDKNGNFVYTYGWHISDLVIYDEPKELSEFYRMCPSFYKDELKSNDCLECEDPCGNGGKLYLTKPPQSWCYVERMQK